MNLQLQCAFCHKPFSDFGPLGAHVRTSHPEIGRLLRRLKISAAGQVSPAETLSSGETNSMRATTPQKGSTDMAKVKKYDRLPTLDEDLFEKLKNKRGEVVCKLDGSFVWKSREGMTLNLSSNGKKFSFLVSFDRFDIRSLFSQMEGQEFKFVAREGKDRTFINAYNPYSKE